MELSWGYYTNPKKFYEFDVVSNLFEAEQKPLELDFGIFLKSRFGRSISLLKGASLETKGATEKGRFSLICIKYY